MPIFLFPAITVKNLDDQTNKWTLEVVPALNPDKTYKLTIVYTGINRNDMHGFYRSSYKKEDGSDRYVRPAIIFRN